MMDLFSDDTMVRFKLVELWLDMIEAEREDSRQLSGVNLEGAGVIQWLSKQYEDGSEEAKGLLMRCMSVGVELPEYEGEDHQYPPELYEAADFPVRGVSVTTRTERRMPKKGF